MRRFFLSLVFSSIILSGCGVTDFIGAYFNTYYNAQKTFTEAEQEVLAAGITTVGTKTEKPFLAPFDVPAQTKTKFTTVIEKCSKLLQYHPDSKLVDDALLMIGKSYYYQNEHESAARKFKELLTSYPESDLMYEAKLLLANTYYRNNDKPTAMETAKELLVEAQKEGIDNVAAGAANLLAHIEAEDKNYPQALEHFQITANLSETDGGRAEAFRSVADMHIHQGQYQKAVEDFQKSEDVSNNYVGVYKGELGRARTLSKMGNRDESLSVLEDLIKDQNYKEFYGEINLEIATVHRDQSDLVSAEKQYRYVDTAYARTETAANSYYLLGSMYEKKLMNYDSARVAYDKGKTEFPQAEITATLVKRSDFLNKYFAFHNEIAKYDSIRNFILHAPDTTGAALDTTNKNRTSKIRGTRQDTTARGMTKQDTSGKEMFRQDIARLDTSIQDSSKRDTTGHAMFKQEISNRDTSRQDTSKQDIATEDISTQDISKQVLLKQDMPGKNISSEGMSKQDSAIALARRDSLTRKNASVPPPPMDTVQARLASNESELASLFYARLEVPDSAIYWYSRLLAEHPRSPYAPRALYTLAQIYSQDSTVGPSRLDSLHREIVKRFPASEFAIESRHYLHLPELALKVDSSEFSYKKAEALVQKGNVVAALDSFKIIAARDSSSPYAAKAQYAVGWIYENVKINSDSSVASYQKLVKKFPASQYATLVQPKLAEVEADNRQKLENARRDSAAAAHPKGEEKSHDIEGMKKTIMKGTPADSAAPAGDSTNIRGDKDKSPLDQKVKDRLLKEPNDSTGVGGDASGNQGDKHKEQENEMMKARLRKETPPDSGSLKQDSIIIHGDKDKSPENETMKAKLTPADSTGAKGDSVAQPQSAPAPADTTHSQKSEEENPKPK